MRNMVPARSLARRSRNLMLLAVLLIVFGIVILIFSSFHGDGSDLLQKGILIMVSINLPFPHLPGSVVF